MGDTDPEYLDLLHKLHQADWNTGCTARSTAGVTITFRKHYSSDAPGVEKRQAHGKDDKEAIREFLTKLGEQISR